MIGACWFSMQTSHGHGWLLVSHGDSTDDRLVLAFFADKPWAWMDSYEPWRALVQMLG